jgi:hypothetical protein
MTDKRYNANMNQETELAWYKFGTLIFAIGFFWVCSAMSKLTQELCDAQQELKEQAAHITETPPEPIHTDVVPLGRDTSWMQPDAMEWKI